MNNKEEKTLFENFPILFGGLALVPAMLLASAALGGWVISVLWGWFVVPTFHVAAITVPQAIGVDLIVTYMTWHGYKADDAGFWTAFSKACIVKPGSVLFIGWAIHRFFM